MQRFTGNKRLYIRALRLPFFFVALTSFPWIAAMPHAARQAAGCPRSCRCHSHNNTPKTRSQPHNKERKTQKVERKTQRQHTGFLATFPFFWVTPSSHNRNACKVIQPHRVNLRPSTRSPPRLCCMRGSGGRKGEREFRCMQSKRKH